MEIAIEIQLQELRIISCLLSILGTQLQFSNYLKRKTSKTLRSQPITI